MIFVIFILTLLLFMFYLNIKYINTNGYKNINQQLEKFNNVPENLKIVCTGSSYAKYGIDFLNLPGFNFALAPQSISYDFKILKHYAPQISQNSIIVIVLPDLVFAFRDYKDKQIDYRYYKFLDAKYINNYSKIDAFFLNYFPILKAGRQIRYLLRDAQPVDEMKVMHYWNNEKECVKFAEERIIGWQKQFKMNKLDVECISLQMEKEFNFTVSLLKNMIKYCIDMKWRPVLVVPPCSKILNSKIDRNFVDKVLFNNIKRANIYDIPLLNYLYDEEFSDYKLYLWSDCLNPEGRKRFTKRLLYDIKKFIYSGDCYDV